VGCSPTAPAASEAPLGTPGPPSPAGTAQPTSAALPTPLPVVRAPSGVATAASVRGTIYLGFESCVALTPDAASGYLPPVGEEFVLFFPKGWKVVPEHPRSPRFGDHFEIRDRAGHLVARDGDALEVTGEIRAIAATFCGFGWPISVQKAVRVEG
jgi:hypothetical protein